MAIRVSFNGATIYKPGAYSKQSIDLGAGFPIGPSGLIAIFGEADAGAPGSDEVNIADNRYTGSQLIALRDKYKSGPIVDAANFLFAPASDAAIPSGAQTVWVYKTNASTRAEHALSDSGGEYQNKVIAAREYGLGGNRMTAECTLTAETAPTVTGVAFDEGAAIAASDKFTVQVNGGSQYEFTANGAPYADNAALATAIALGTNWTGGVGPVGFTCTVGGVNSASTLTIAPTADATNYRNGYGRNFEISESTSGHAIKFGLTVGQTLASVEPSCSITLKQTRDSVEEEDTSLGGNIVLKIGSTATVPTVTIDANNILLKENGSTVKTFIKSEYNALSEVATEINLMSGWYAAVGSSAYNQLSSEVLDQVTDLGCLIDDSSTPVYSALIKKDAYEVSEFFELSSLAEIGTTGFTQLDPVTGLPETFAETQLIGAVRGPTLSADITAALTAFQKFHVNSIVPLFSRDAQSGGTTSTDDYTDGLTDSGSTYTIAAIHTGVKTHLTLMKTTKRRSERQGYLSLKDTWEDTKTQAYTLADGRVQIACQDVRTIDGQGVIKWFQPWALSCMLAGARGGSPIGTPLTFKNMNVAGIRQTGQAMTVADADIVIDFDPDLEYEEAIQAGVTFLEAPTTGGFRVVVDNTTYGKDENFVWNRANVIYAADTVAYNLRDSLEKQFVGQKNTITAQLVASSVESLMARFLGQGIIVASDDAPAGFKDLTVTIDGNTINVGVVVKIVEGIDFVLADISIQRKTSSL